MTEEALALRVARAKEGTRTLLVCRGTGCESSGSALIQAGLEAEIARRNLPNVEV